MKQKSIMATGMVVFCFMLMATGAAWSASLPSVPNGTVTVNGLVWLKNAGCLGKMNWGDAMVRAQSLKSGECGLNDGSKAGQWRLPTKDELQSIYHSKSQFNDVQSDFYWSSTTLSYGSSFAWSISMVAALVSNGTKTRNYYVWPVRGGP